MYRKKITDENIKLIFDPPIKNPFDIEKFKTSKDTYLLNGIEYEKKYIPAGEVTPESWHYVKVENKNEIC